jgi:hypothetical protein
MLLFIDIYFLEYNSTKNYTYNRLISKFSPSRGDPDRERGAFKYLFLHPFVCRHFPYKGKTQIENVIIPK